MARPAAPPPVVPGKLELDPFFDDLERRTFQFFWDTANTENGLVPDKAPANSACSIAAVGFGLTAYPIGVERGYITREQARERTLTTLRFFRYAPQGPEAEGITGYHGFFYHFLDMQTGLRTDRSELSTIDTALLLAGMLFSQSYFNGDDPQELEIRTLVDTIYRRVDWTWATTRAPAVVLGWSPEAGFIKYDWRGYNEAMLIYLLALGSPTHPLQLDSWSAWTGTYDLNWGVLYGQEFLNFPPLFGHQYSHVWVDFRGIQDAYMRGRGIDYFENSRRATYAQRAYAIDNPQKFTGYTKDIWGLTASDGPVDTFKVSLLRPRHFLGYSARGVGGIHIPDDGTIAPTAAAASLPFAPEIVIPALHAMHDRYGVQIYSTYGFVDAFNPSFTYDYTTMQLRSGKVVPGMGWVDSDFLGIDQGPILAMIENYRSDFVWRYMRENVYLRRGLEHAGFSGGWLGAPAPASPSPALPVEPAPSGAVQAPTPSQAAATAPEVASPAPAATVPPQATPTVPVSPEVVLPPPTAAAPDVTPPPVAAPLPPQDQPSVPPEAHDGAPPATDAPTPQDIPPPAPTAPTAPAQPQVTPTDPAAPPASNVAAPPAAPTTPAATPPASPTTTTPDAPAPVPDPAVTH